MCLTYNTNGEVFGSSCQGAQQEWTLKDLHLVSGKEGNYCLEVSTTDNLGGNPQVELAICDWDSDYQTFTFQVGSGGYYTIKAINGHGGCLDYDDEASYATANVYMHDCLYNKANQQWRPTGL